MECLKEKRVLECSLQKTLFNSSSRNSALNKPTCKDPIFPITPTWPHASGNPQHVPLLKSPVSMAVTRLTRRKAVPCIVFPIPMTLLTTATFKCPNRPFMSALNRYHPSQSASTTTPSGTLSTNYRFRIHLRNNNTCSFLCNKYKRVSVSTARSLPTRHA